MKKNDLSVPIPTQLIELGKNWIALAVDSLNLAKAESKLAKQSLKVILWLFPASLIFGLCSWLCCLGMFYSSFSALGISPCLNFLLLALVNGGFGLGTWYLLRHYRTYLKFNETRQLFRKREKNHEFIKKESQHVQNEN